MTTLREAAQAVLARWDSPSNAGCADLMDALRTALAESPDSTNPVVESEQRTEPVQDEHDLTTVYLAGRMDERKVQRTGTVKDDTALLRRCLELIHCSGVKHPDLIAERDQLKRDLRERLEGKA